MLSFVTDSRPAPVIISTHPPFLLPSLLLFPSFSGLNIARFGGSNAIYHPTNERPAVRTVSFFFIFTLKPRVE
jgi:hypothetical protein